MSVQVSLGSSSLSVSSPSHERCYRRSSPARRIIQRTPYGGEYVPGVPAVDKAARLLAELREDESLGISELARRITASKGTVRDILLTLASHDLITRGGSGPRGRG